jgi:hypothetical protein
MHPGYLVGILVFSLSGLMTIRDTQEVIAF